MDYPILYRKRIIPDECVQLRDDRILFMDDRLIITEWKALHPKPDLSSGFSCYYLQEGCKVSRFCRSDDSLLYWYCDIVDYGDGIRDGSLITTDLLVDVIVRPDGTLRVVDLDELADAFDRGLIDDRQLKTSLLNLNHLLKRIDNEGIESLAEPMRRFYSKT
ncbi:MAG: DUF402 domain-containing protein [Lachnospiraceae bacterium]|nr:DUF402 domain-containing protein [Lachnospiraceae bacterium]